MKRKISRLLLKAARWLCPSIAFEDAPCARAMGLCIHISKKDVRDLRKGNPSIKSHREGVKALVKEAEWQIAGAIGRGLMERGVIDFDVKKNLFSADVNGIVYVYCHEEEPPTTESS